MSISNELYRKWLTSAYLYYWGMGDDPESPMTDSEWDFVGRQINIEDHDELSATGYRPGQSLFWLSKDKYPDWAKPKTN